MNTTPQITTAEAFIASGDKLYQRQRERMQVAQAAYQEERFRLLQGYELKLAQLANEHADALRELERRYAREQADNQRMLSALEAVREG